MPESSESVKFFKKALLQERKKAPSKDLLDLLNDLEQQVDFLDAIKQDDVFPEEREKDYKTLLAGYNDFHAQWDTLSQDIQIRGRELDSAMQKFRGKTSNNLTEDNLLELETVQAVKKRQENSQEAIAPLVNKKKLFENLWELYLSVLNEARILCGIDDPDSSFASTGSVRSQTPESTFCAKKEKGPRFVPDLVKNPLREKKTLKSTAKTSTPLPLAAPDPDTDPLDARTNKEPEPERGHRYCSLSSSSTRPRSTGGDKGSPQEEPSTQDHDAAHKAKNSALRNETLHPLVKDEVKPRAPVILTVGFCTMILSSAIGVAVFETVVNTTIALAANPALIGVLCLAALAVVALIVGVVGAGLACHEKAKSVRAPRKGILNDSRRAPRAVTQVQSVEIVEGVSATNNT